ncbi:prepilin-type N-terminal cleavage/methylation domain-containing protein [Desulfobacula toluolica]|uniref:Prepilin-type cleavage/methylation domain protein n=1 Tax=Desulfobacula toluolica (strain DSM 7467 / Tol2) TaxID=651182 RepID=K0NK79_DESTT|nr:PilW family protein [Desulfobacula toluolica]CCK80318.1 prepilin-type cleavage/methylation domain protein [Desulfobacula toluolica Tol2]
MKKNKYHQKGFTLIEVMITMAISTFILGGIFLTYSNQQKTYVSSDRLAEMQQNLRSAIMIMSSEIREAGCDPTQKANAGIISATSVQLHFTRDIAGHALNKDNRADGELDDANEDITFGFSSTNDADSNGIADTGAANLGRDTGGGFQPIAENIQAIEFNYILDDGTTAPNPTASQLSEIRAVQISILARASASDPNFMNAATYTTSAGTVWGPFNDNFKRRFVVVTIQCRNLGI